MMALHFNEHDALADDIFEAPTTPAAAHMDKDGFRKPLLGLPWWKRYLIRHPSTLSLLVQVIGEVIGSFLLMFFLCGITMGDLISHGGNMSSMTHAVTAAFCIMLIIFALGHISGAHVNPAVTVGFASIGRFPWKQVPWYVIGQLMGGVVGTLVAGALYGVDVDLVLSLPAAGRVGMAFMIELIITVVFMFLACSVSCHGQVTGLHAAIAMAVSIVLNIVVAGPISGASMNPVRSLAPAIVAGKYEYVWIYMLAPPLGTVLGAWMHKLLLNLLALSKHDHTISPLP